MLSVFASQQGQKNKKNKKNKKLGTCTVASSRRPWVERHQIVNKDVPAETVQMCVKLLLTIRCSNLTHKELQTANETAVTKTSKMNPTEMEANIPPLILSKFSILIRIEVSTMFAINKKNRMIKTT